MSKNWNKIDDQNVETVQTLMELCNIMGNEQALVANLTSRLNHEHRTIQQTFIGVLRQVIANYANTVGDDARNEASKAWARKVRDLDGGLGGFPFI